MRNAQDRNHALLHHTVIQHNKSMSTSRLRQSTASCTSAACSTKYRKMGHLGGQEGNLLQGHQRHPLADKPLVVDGCNE